MGSGLSPSATHRHGSHAAFLVLGWGNYLHMIRVYARADPAFVVNLFTLLGGLPPKN